MKHKAQEPLEFLFDEAAEEYELDEENVDLICYDKTSSDKYLNPFWVIQDLINCQLTVEEMNYIRNLLYIVPDKDRTIIISILAKLSKQKEMWVSENVFK